MMSILYTAILGTACVLILMDVLVRIRHRAAVPGSYKKYQLTTILIVVTSLKILTGIGIIILSIPRGFMFSAGIWVCVVAMDIWDLKKLLNDDNWFNNQYKRLKRGLKNLQTRLSTLASPMPTPA